MSRTVRNTILPVLFILQLAVCCFAAENSPAPFFADVKLSRDKVYIGERFELSVEIRYRPEYSVKKFLPLEYLGSFEVKDYTPGKEKKKYILFGEKYQVYRFALSTFVSGSYEIPQMSIVFTDGKSEQELLTSALKLEVESKISDKDTDILDLKRPAGIPLPRYLYIIAVLFPLALVAGLFIYQHYFQKAKYLRISAEEIKTPYQIALEALEAAGRMEISSPEEIKTYYFLLSEILRKYLGALYEANLIDMTTTEAVRALKNASAERKTISSFLDFSEKADLVKFAKLFPSAQESAGALEELKNIIESENKSGSANYFSGPSACKQGGLRG